MSRDQNDSMGRSDARASQKFCAVITPPGRGAVAVVVVNGPNVDHALESLFSSASHRRLADHPSQQIFYGYWNSTGEDVVLVRINHHRFEIHCHGGKEASQAILKSLQPLGFQCLDRATCAVVLHGGRWKSGIAMAISEALTEETAKL